MSAEAKPQTESQLNAAAKSQAAEDAGKQPVKKSWRRKYRKMRAKFESTMVESNQLIKDECKCANLARRLQEQNDQLLELLLDLNDSTRALPYLRYDLRSPSPSESVFPSTETDVDPERQLRELREELVAERITPEEFAAREAQIHGSASLITKPKSLSSLVAKTPHTSELPDQLPEGMMIGDNAPGYYTPNHEEEFLLAVDSQLNDPSYDPSAHDSRPLRISSTQPMPTDKELTIRNPDSVYNWLRKHQPQVFLQDKESHNETISEKSARPEKGPGRGKRPSAISATTPGPKADPDMLDEDFIPETGTGGKGRRAAKNDDEPYRPKGGSSRPGKRKREDGEGGGRGGRKKGRASAVSNSGS